MPREHPHVLEHEKSRAAEAQPVMIVIFGASGDLTRRKLVPALFALTCEGLMPEHYTVLGLARSQMTNESFRDELKDGVESYGRITEAQCQRWREFADRFRYMAIGYDDPESYTRLAESIRSFEAQHGCSNALFYLATPPQLYATVVERLGEAGLGQSETCWRRIVVEKPFGHDLISAQALNDQIHEVFDEHQVYRIDHYLGKETVQNLLVFRFANAIFEPIWNRRYVDNVMITVAESVGVGSRGGYYDQAGVMRDMIQNHALQLLTLTAMEPPVSLNATALRNEKVKVLESIRPVRPEGVGAMSVRAQYRSSDGTGPTYRQEAGVASESETATYTAIKLLVDNWRWQGVPFYIRSGKLLHRKSTDIAIRFKRVPHLMFPKEDPRIVPPNTLGICIQPDEGIHLSFKMKMPGAGMMTQKVDMEFHYDADGGLPDAYERLLIDALQGDPSLFARSDEIEHSWRIVDSILEGWQAGRAPLAFYEPGSHGPREADDLLAQDGFEWLPGCEEH